MSSLFQDHMGRQSLGQVRPRVSSLKDQEVATSRIGKAKDQKQVRNQGSLPDTRKSLASQDPTGESLLDSARAI